VLVLVVMAFMLVVVPFVQGILFVVVVVIGLGRIGPGAVFEGIGRTQRFAFQARLARRTNSRSGCYFGLIPGCKPPIPRCKLSIPATNCRMGLRFAAKPAQYSQGYASSHGKLVCWQGQTGRAGRGAEEHRGRHVTAQ
jgi:hypothetical protein